MVVIDVVGLAVSVVVVDVLDVVAAVVVVVVVEAVVVVEVVGVGVTGLGVVPFLHKPEFVLFIVEAGVLYSPFPFTF